MVSGGRFARCVTLALLAAGATAALPAGAAGTRFREVSRDWVAAFRHHHGGAGERYMIETMVGGVVLFDYDLDGDLDLFWVDGAALPGYQGEAPKSRLLRNDGGRFVDVTERAAVDFTGYGCGGVAADYDGDGDLDLYLTAFGPNRLYRNRGDGTFEEVSAAAGVDDPAWSASAAFADVDRDGDLDLYVANYVDFAFDNHKFCGDEERGLRGYCHPGVYNGLPDRFYGNRGDGTFEEATEKAGLAGPAEAGLGSIFADLDNDGWIDLYVANDADPNLVFRNLGDGTFEDISLLSGASYSDEGRPEAGMGVDAGDVDGDGLLDVVVTNFEFETNALYRNLGGGVFADARYPSGIAEPSLLKLAFGTAFADFDHDADLDLVIANGHILDNAELFNAASRFAQPNQLFENAGDGKFREVEAGLERVAASRGLAAGDLDGDGDLDLAILNSDDWSEVYENVSPREPGGWLLLDLEAASGNRFAIGGRVTLLAGERRLVGEVKNGSSYLSQGTTSLHFGLGGAAAAREVGVGWPDGRRQRFASLPANRRIRLARVER